ncbi:MAG: hypothetical protein MK161_06200 [Pirellulales bacterium]|nr:hypothetical protein [Pirellulales bacterium]
MNKAFVREPEPDGRAYCPRCGTLGTPVNAGPLNTHIQVESRARMHEAAWYCGFARCEVAYFNLFESVVLVEELKTPIYPYDLAAPMCACFGLCYDDVEADVHDSSPTRIRGLLAKSQSAEASCQRLAVDGQCCMTEVQKLYMKLRTEASAE